MTASNYKGRYGQYVHNMITFGDFIVLNAAFFITFAILGHFADTKLRFVVLLLNVAYLPIPLFFGRTHKRRTLLSQYVVRNAILSVLLHFLFFTVLLFAMDSHWVPWHFYAWFYPIFTVMLSLWWVTARKIMSYYRRKGYNFSSVIIVGTGPTAINLYKEIKSDAGFGYKFEGFFSDDPNPDIPEGTYRGRLEDISDFVRDNGISEVFYTLSGERDLLLREVINATESNVAHFYYVPQINRYVNRGFVLHTLGTVPVLSLMEQPLESLINRGMKRTFDIVFSSIFLLFSPIIFIPVAIAIKLSSPGPVFFRQLRTGYKGRDFYCWKFRTMKVNADADTKQASRDDPRKTRVGDFLRKTSIDELPQFINVFLGDMSVVGPRPHMLKHTKEYSQLIDKYMVRHFIKPGITGWAQVSGFRGQTEELWQMEERVEHDVWYIKHWSFLLDIRIIFKTLLNAIHGEKNAF